MMIKPLSKGKFKMWLTTPARFGKGGIAIVRALNSLYVDGPLDGLWRRIGLLRSHAILCPFPPTAISATRHNEIYSMDNKKIVKRAKYRIYH
jgi:hypothetical protein